jgi:hypothetical protein
MWISNLGEILDIPKGRQSCGHSQRETEFWIFLKIGRVNTYFHREAAMRLFPMGGGVVDIP